MSKKGEIGPVVKVLLDRSCRSVRLLVMELRISDIGKFRLINDTHLECGTKMRGYAFFEKLKAKGVTAIATVASCHGYGQIATAWCCAQAGLNCTIFSAGRSQLTKVASDLGANMVICPSFTKTSQMEGQAKLIENSYFVKCGLADDDFITEMAENIKAAAKDEVFGRIWLVAGSCTIALALRQAFPDAHLNLVKVGFPIWDDLQDRLNRCKITIYTAPERFSENARIMPPYSSVANYDAKLWQFVRIYGLTGDVIWNVK